MALAVTSFCFCYRFATIFFKQGIFKPGMVLLYWDEVAAKIINLLIHSNYYLLDRKE